MSFLYWKIFKYSASVIVSSTIVGCAAHNANQLPFLLQKEEKFEVEMEDAKNVSSSFPDFFNQSNSNYVEQDEKLKKQLNVLSKNDFQNYEIHKLDISEDKNYGAKTIVRANSEHFVDHNFYKILDSFELDNSIFLNNKNKISDPQIFIDFSIKINEKKNIFVNYLLNFNDFLYLEQKIINLTKISDETSSNIQNVLLQINYNQKTQKIHLNFLLQKNSQINQEKIELLKEKISFYFLYKDKQEEILEIQNNKSINSNSTNENSHLLSNIVKKAKKRKAKNKNWFLKWNSFDNSQQEKDFTVEKIELFSSQNISNKNNKLIGKKKYKINKEIWNKKLINSEIWGKENVPKNTNKKTRLGILFNQPINLKIKDIKNNSIWESDYVIFDEIDLSHFAYTNKFLVNTLNIPINKLIENEQETKDEKNIKFFIFASIDKDSLTIETQIQTENIDEKDISIFDFDDENFSKTSKLINFSISNQSSLMPYWWTSSSEDEFTIDKLDLEKLDSRVISFVKNLSDEDKQLQYALALSSKKSEKEGLTSDNLNEIAKIYEGYVWNSNYLNVFGIHEKELTKEEKVTTIKAPISHLQADNYRLKLRLEGLDSESASLLFNPTHKHSSQQTIFTNGNSIVAEENIPYDPTNSTVFKETPIKDGNKETHHKYQKKEENQSYFDLKKYDLQTDLLVDISKISTDKNKPTLVPFRLTINHDKKAYPKNWSELETPISKLSNTLIQNDKSILGKTLNSSQPSRLVEVQKISELNNFQTSFAVVFWDVFIWKEATNQDLTFHIQLKMWGCSYSLYRPSNFLYSPLNVVAAEGSAGFQLSDVFIEHKNQKSKNYQAI